MPEHVEYVLERRPVTPYSEAIRRKIEPLMGIEGKEDARLQLELGRNYFKIRESPVKRDSRGRVIRDTEILSIADIKEDFLKAYSFASLLTALYLAGDTAAGVNRNKIKLAICSDVISVDIWVNEGVVNRILKELIIKYDVFGKRERKIKKTFDDATESMVDVEVFEKDLDFVKLGYTLRDNLSILITDKSIQVL